MISFGTGCHRYVLSLVLALAMHIPTAAWVFDGYVLVLMTLSMHAFNRGFTL